MSAPRSPARAEVVGSLLRPQSLLEARAGRDPALEEIVDAEVRAAVQRQVDLGLDVVTDGEFGRDAFTHSFYDAIEGIEPSPVPVRFRNAAGTPRVRERRAAAVPAEPAGPTDRRRLSGTVSLRFDRSRNCPRNPCLDFCGRAPSLSGQAL